jgi:hypothetical protein
MHFFCHIYFENETLHVSDSSSVHHQDLFTVHSAMVYMIQTAFKQDQDGKQFHPDPARKLSRNLYGIRGQSTKKPNIWNSQTASTRSTLVMVALYSGDFKLYSDTSSITPPQLVIEWRALDWVSV